MRRLYEARIEDLKAEHRRMVKLMADEIEYLRVQLSGPKLGMPGTAIAPAEVKVFDEPDFMPDPAKSPHFIPEEQEDLLALRDGGHIDEIEYQQAMQRLGALGITAIETD